MNGTLIFVTKWPSIGASKTRLIPDLGEEGAFLLAKAMVEDLIIKFSSSESLQNINKVLYFAPEEAKEDACSFLQQNDITEQWVLLPMIQSNELQSPDLGDKLVHAHNTCTQWFGPGATAFVGMDTPQLPAAAVARALAEGRGGRAFVCPATDGGYVLLGLPAGAPAEACFRGVRWSADTTCEDQVRAINAASIEVVTGDIYTDVDDAEDMEALISYLLQESYEDRIQCSRCCEVLNQIILKRISGEQRIQERSSGGPDILSCILC